MKKAVIYARYSSDTQTEQSIEGQIRVCRDYAKNNNILIVDTYVDRAMTGTNDMRPDFQRMIKDSNKRQWDYVLVYKLDRFSRNKYETTIHKHTLKENGVKVLSAMENIPDSPEGIILESLLEGMNQYYSAELSQKVHRGLNESYRKGQYTGGPVIYGYKVVDKKNVIDEFESEIIREVFQKYANGYTAVSIAKDLKSRGIRTKTGAYLTQKRLYKIFSNTKYNGKIKHGDQIYDNIYPKIIDDETWAKVQNIKQENVHSPGRKKEIYNYILSGKLICKNCKRLMVGISGTGKSGAVYYYYSCLSKRQKNNPCITNAVDKQELEDLVIKTTINFLSDNAIIQKIAFELNKLHEENSKNDTNLKSLIAKRQNALKASNNLIKAIEQGIITEQTKLRLKELETQISQYDFDIENEKLRNYSTLSVKDIENYLHSIINTNADDIQVRKLLVNTFIKEIILDNETVTIVYNFTENPISERITNDTTNSIIKRSEQVALNKKVCSNILPSLPPKKRNTNTCCLYFSFLFIRGFERLGSPAYHIVSDR